MDHNEIEKIEAELRAGNFDKVKEVLAKYKFKKINRNFVVKLANFSRRIGYHRNALRLLNPIVRPRKPIHPAASQEELIEYAVNLTRVGLIQEAQGILNSIKNQNLADVTLYKAFCATMLWDNDKAVPLLEKYLENTSITPYQRLVAQVNLALDYTYSFRFNDSEKLFNQIIKTTKVSEHKLVVGYAHQAFAEHYICRGVYKQAIPHLNEARNLLSDSHHRYAIYNRQWAAIGDLIASKGSLESKKILKEVKKEALKKKVWESARDCDLYMAIYSNDANELLKVYFGSPLVAYRKRIIRLYPEKIQIPDSYMWAPGDKPKKSNHYFDVAKGKDALSGAKLKSGQLLHRLLQTLSSDFYQPFKVEYLFSQVFPNQYYNPESSAHKVHDAIGRLRTWFDKHGIPLTVRNLNRGEFQLNSTSPYGLLVGEFSKVNDSGDLFLQKLKSGFGSNWFVMKDVISLTGGSRTTCKRNLKQALDTKVLIVQGAGRRARYKIAS